MKWREVPHTSTPCPALPATVERWWRFRRFAGSGPGRLAEVKRPIRQISVSCLQWEGEGTNQTPQKQSEIRLKTIMAAPIVPDGVAGGARYGYHPGIQTSNPSHIQIMYVQWSGGRSGAPHKHCSCSSAVSGDLARAKMRACQWGDRGSFLGLTSPTRDVKSIQEEESVFHSKDEAAEDIVAGRILIAEAIKHYGYSRSVLRT
eukprot:scaffold3656_cov154-Ochromonas_danica.AAC.1